MYVHAWQSYIWNRLVSERVRLFGAKEPVEGDLVYVEEGAKEEEKQVEANGDGAETKEEGKTSGEHSHPNALPSSPAELTLLISPSRVDPSSAEAQQAFYISTSSLPKVRPLTAADITSKSHSIYDILLPMPGFAVTYPGGELGEMYKRVIREDGIDPEKMWRKQKEYSLVCSGLDLYLLVTRVDGKMLGLVRTGRNVQEDLAST